MQASQTRVCILRKTCFQDGITLVRVVHSRQCIEEAQIQCSGHQRVLEAGAAMGLRAGLMVPCSSGSIWIDLERWWDGVLGIILRFFLRVGITRFLFLGFPQKERALHSISVNLESLSHFCIRALSFISHIYAVSYSIWRVGWGG